MTSIKRKLFTLAPAIFFSFGAYAQLDFEPIHYYQIGHFNSRDVAAADLNNNGKQDIAITLSGQYKVALLTNPGNGIFDAPTFHNIDIDDALGERPGGIAFGDVNGDSFLDMVTTNPIFFSYHNKISVSLNNGDGTFATPTFYDADLYPYAVLLKDFNGDNKLDMVATNYADTTISVFMNNGDGTFAPQVGYTVGANPTGLVSGDFDGDGSWDLALTRNGGGLLLRNNGDGIFSQWPLPSISSEYQNGEIVAADVNGDNKPDLIISTSGVDKKFSVFINDGNGGFAPPVSYPRNSGIIKMVASDINGDGKTDLVIVNSTWGLHNNIYLNDGTGAFGAVINIPGLASPTGLAVADLNGDGKPDIVNISSFTDSISVILQASPTGTGTYTIETTAPVKLFPNPGMGVVTLVSPAKDVLKVYDATGRLLETLPINQGNNNINTQSWSAGMYLFEIGGRAVKFEKAK